MASFNWQTEEEGNWGDATPIHDQREETGQRKWLSIAVVTIGILLVSGLLYYQLRNRVGGAEEARNEDIVAANNLLVYAADRKDPSVLLNILPLENADWTRMQRSLTRQGLLLDRWPMGIQRSDEEPTLADITLSPDLQQADVTIEIPYQVYDQGRPENIRLQQVHHYEFSNEWHWVEPNDAYWGGIGQGVYEPNWGILVFYPLRDEEVVRRIIDDLPTYLTNLCSEPGLPGCRFVMDFEIRFERDAAVWEDMVSRIEENGSYIPRFSPVAQIMTLPTPSLVGIPVDEAGYQALLQGYASHIFSAIMAALYEDDCCPNDLTFPLFLESEMAKRGIGFWPPPVLSEEIAAQKEAGTLPDKDIALLCAVEDRLQLYRFSVSNGRVWANLAGRNIVRVRSMPNGMGIIAQEVDYISEEEVLTRLIYWYGDTARILYEETLPEPVFAASSWQIHDDEQRLLMVVPDLDSRVTTFVQIDLSDCANGNCPRSTQELIGSPTWSPDGSQFLIKSGNILWWRQLVGSDVDQEPLGLGTVPFWLDEDTFGFVRTGENRFQEIVTASPGDEEMTAVLDTERLRLLLTGDGRPDQLMIGYVGIDPVISGDELTNWTILGFDWLANGELGRAYVFSYNPEVDNLSLLLQSDQLHSFNLSPDGRLLAASLYDDDLESWRLKIEPIEEGLDATVLPWQAKDKEISVRYDWSADSKWLLVLHQGMITLYSPETEAVQLAPPPVPGCAQAVWMN